MAKGTRFYSPFIPRYPFALRHIILQFTPTHHRPQCYFSVSATPLLSNSCVLTLIFVPPHRFGHKRFINPLTFISPNFDPRTFGLVSEKKTFLYLHIPYPSFFVVLLFHCSHKIFLLNSKTLLFFHSRSALPHVIRVRLSVKTEFYSNFQPVFPYLPIR